MTAIRRFQEDDWPALWAILEPVFRAGETYSYPTDITEAGAYDVWVAQPQATFVAVDADGVLLGSYFLKPNQPGSGNHVCNCGYVVDTRARGRGVATALCEHSQREAVAHRFRAMQYNLVVATNTAAWRLWQRLGFEIVGTLAGAFRHPAQGDVDAYVMYKRLAG